MGIALTDDHRELGEVARSFLTAQKARWAARELLDAAEGTDRRSGRSWPNWAGWACTSTSSTAAPVTGCRSWSW